MRCASSRSTPGTLTFSRACSGRNLVWAFSGEGGDIDVATKGGYGTAGDVLSGVTIACSGAGLFQTYRFVAEQDLRDGRLVDFLALHLTRTRPAPARRQPAR